MTPVITVFMALMVGIILMSILQPMLGLSDLVG